MVGASDGLVDDGTRLQPWQALVDESCGGRARGAEKY
jgi:hypothetical protein